VTNQFLDLVQQVIVVSKSTPLLHLFSTLSELRFQQKLISQVNFSVSTTPTKIKLRKYFHESYHNAHFLNSSYKTQTEEFVKKKKKGFSTLKIEI